jgi:pyruvate formate lyase activating enzyme
MIDGFQPCSFIDFPGCLSAAVFLRGCNLRCPYCHNACLLDGDGPSRIGEPDLLSFLASRRGRLDGVVISGGEPTLEPRLRPLIEAVRALGYRVKLDTNGTRPEVLSELLGGSLIDYVALDLKDEPAAYPEWLGSAAAPEAVHRSIDILKRSGIDHELRTTVVLPRHDASRLGRMARVVAGAKRWVLQPYRPVGSLSAEPGLRAPSRQYLEEVAESLCSLHGVDCFCRGATSNKRSTGHCASAVH